ncbi:3-dehydroquinate synthase family protein [Bdellovibrio svalbardensis]|uniref:3-dehydroquinate synthase n=1 Tax=Bdellovibrio svalbardensis TaxID=2972972 RepID=A0ABT6DEL9_9BACT|nr:hypothetical protein [Bdellovibrio svalbardensis]MDG0815271.1 hypothetical protein [Bdellovibrio svalbardensis]
MKPSAVLFTQNFPAPKKLGEELLLIYDEVLPKKSEEFKKWMKQIPLRYAVQAGEGLKSIDLFPDHISKITTLCEKASVSKLTIVVVGGGSVGDFGGFVASILKRGVRLIHLPSTWLAAIDSAHGGKTALNVGGAKNQIGTFYPATEVVLVKSLLLSQPPSRTFEGFGELLKIALIEGGILWAQLSREYEVNAEVLWKYLEAGIKAKYKVVKKDPEEKKGLRHVLNLGHTVGHVLESYYELPHGISINYGLEFALRWSVEKKIMAREDFDRLQRQPVMAYLLSASADQLWDVKANVLKEFRRLLLNDKKKTKSETLRFVFIKKAGQTVIKEVPVDDILVEICRQREEELNG